MRVCVAVNATVSLQLFEAGVVSIANVVGVRSLAVSVFVSGSSIALRNVSLVGGASKANVTLIARSRG